MLLGMNEFEWINMIMYRNRACFLRTSSMLVIERSFRDKENRNERI